MARSISGILGSTADSLAAATAEITAATTAEQDSGAVEGLATLQSRFDELVRAVQEHVTPKGGEVTEEGGSGAAASGSGGGDDGDNEPSRKRARAAAAAAAAPAPASAPAPAPIPAPAPAPAHMATAAPGATAATAVAAVTTTPAVVAAARATQDPMATVLLPELLMVVLRALTPRDLARLESAGSHYADRPGAVRCAVGERLVARLGREEGGRPMARRGLTHRLEVVESMGKVGVGSRLSGGNNHLLMVDGEGRVSSCGLGYDGQLGHGDENHVGVPRRVAALASIVVVQVAAGFIHSMALAADGGVWSWGDGGDGQLGHGDQEDKVRCAV